jgi:glycopeptide antibiotics resistance protein
LTQYLTGRGSLDIDDVILNYSGVILGFVFLWNPLMVKLWKKTKLIEKNG